MSGLLLLLLVAAPIGDSGSARPGEREAEQARAAASDAGSGAAAPNERSHGQARAAGTDGGGGPSAAVAEEPAPEPERACDPALVRQITPVDPWTRAVSAGVLSGLKGCLAGVRVVPSREGQLEGLKVFGIRPGGLAEALAFQNGDLVLSVSGSPLTSPPQILAAWQKHRAEPEVKFSVVRRGEPRTITWRRK